MVDMYVGGNQSFNNAEIKVHLQLLQAVGGGIFALIQPAVDQDAGVVIDMQLMAAAGNTRGTS